MSARRSAPRVGYFAFCIAAALVIAALPPTAPARLQRGVRRHRHRAGVRARLRVPVRDALPRHPQRGQRTAVRQLPRHHRRRRSWSLARRRPSPPSAVLAAIGRPLLFASIDPDVAAARGVPVRAAVGRLPRAARPRRGRGQPDHRLAARVRAARRARRHRPGAHRPTRAARPGVTVVARPGRHLGWARASPTTRRTRSGSGSPPSPSPPTSPPAITCRVAPGRRTRPRSSRPRMTSPLSWPRARATCFAHPFMRNAFLAGTAIALAAGLVGYFLVLRSQVFTGDALSHVAFTGALAALAVRHRRPPRPVRRHHRGRRTSSALLGPLAAAPTTSSSAACSPGSSASACCSCRSTRHPAAPRNGAAGVNVLFGSIFGLNARPDARVAVVIGAGVVVAMLRDRPAAAVRQPRRGRRRRPRRPGARARLRVPRPRRRSPPPRPPRPSARCCCSACSPRRPAPPSGSPTRPYRALRAVRRPRRRRDVDRPHHQLPRPQASRPASPSSPPPPPRTSPLSSSAADISGRCPVS